MRYYNISLILVRTYQHVFSCQRPTSSAPTGDRATATGATAARSWAEERGCWDQEMRCLPFYSSFFCSFFWKQTGRIESTARIPSTAREFQDTASPAVVSLYSVVPALIATNDGGATPVNGTDSAWMSKRKTGKWRVAEGMSGFTKEGTNEEDPQRHIDDGGGNVDKPVGEERGYPQEDDVID